MVFASKVLYLISLTFADCAASRIDAIVEFSVTQRSTEESYNVRFSRINLHKLLYKMMGEKGKINTLASAATDTSVVARGISRLANETKCCAATAAAAGFREDFSSRSKVWGLNATTHHRLVGV